MANSEGLTIHLVPSFHYDVEYLLPEAPYFEICFENLVEAHRLLRAHPEYTFRVEQVFLLEQFLREYPSLLADFRRFAAEGRLADLRPARRGAEFVHQPYALDSAQTHTQDRFRLLPRPCELGATVRSLLAVEGSSIICTAVFPEADCVVVRLYESEGQAAHATLSFHAPVTRVAETNALGEHSTPVPASDGGFPLVFRPFEIKTVRVTLGVRHGSGCGGRGSGTSRALV